MAKRKIVKIGDETLRKPTREVESFDQRLHELLDDMAETMGANNGCGLAANQIGILRKIFIADDGNGVVEFINPRIISKEGEQIGEEGCLSIPDRKEKVTRPKRVQIEYLDRFGKKQKMVAENLMAVIVSHENDHLDGILFTDYLDK